jgi:PAS domain S-box-containing protein
MWDGDRADLVEESETPVNTPGSLYNLAEFTELSLSQIDTQEFINKTVALLVSTLPLSHLVICELRHHKKNLLVRASRGYEKYRVFLDHNRIFKLPKSKYYEQIEDVLILDQESGTQVSVVYPILSEFPNRKTAVVKVPGVLRPWGFIIVCAMNNQDFSTEEISVLKIVAHTLSAFLRRHNNASNQTRCSNEETAPNNYAEVHQNGNQSQKPSHAHLTKREELDSYLASQLLVEEILPISQQTHHLLLDSALMGVYITLNGIITRCNHRFAEMFEYSAEELLGKNLEEIFRAKEKSDSRYCMLSFVNKKNEEGVRIINTQTKKGTFIWVKCVVNTIDSRNGKVALGNVLDITEQVKIEDSLLESEKELRSLSEQLINAQENERKRVASELHDGISQSLSSIKYDVERSKNVCGGINCEVDNLKNFVVQKIQYAIDEVRRISMDLRPSILDDLGIIETINWQLREFQSTHKHIKVKKRIEVREKLIPEYLKISIFRILQEALNNIVKHANANSIKVRFGLLDGRIILTIKDDGQGIGSAKLRRQTIQSERIGFGLKSMQERTHLTGGVIEVSPLLPTGTCIRAQWPVTQKH